MQHPRNSAGLHVQGMSAAKWTGTMEQEVQTFYLKHYRQHWCREHFQDAQQVIPTVSCLHRCPPACRCALLLRGCLSCSLLHA